MQNLIEWFIYSSKDPEKLSLTVKGVVYFLITLATAFGISVSGLDINSYVGLIVDSIVNIASIITSVMALYGLIRKIVITTKDLYTK